MDAKTGLARLACDVSSWWSTLDPSTASAAPASGQPRQVWPPPQQAARLRQTACPMLMPASAHALWWQRATPCRSPSQPAQLACPVQAEECLKLFGLDSSEELMEHFVASLAQTYSCAHNNLTGQPRGAPWVSAP